MLEVTLLGTGTSSGVPTIGCPCRTCRSDDSRDKRLRTSILVETGSENIIIDTSNDFREQCLRHRVTELDAVVYTHHHFDHIAGFDDLRAFNFLRREPVPIYLMPATLAMMEQVFSYAFTPQKNRESSCPVVEVHRIDDDAFTIGATTITPLPLSHGSMRVNGYRIGNFAYCTDCNSISDLAMERLRGVHTLVLDALRFNPHPTHFTLEQAIEVAREIRASRTYFTHIAHDILHAEVEEKLTELGEGMHLAFDGLKLAIA